MRKKLLILALTVALCVCSLGTLGFVGAANVPNFAYKQDAFVNGEDWEKQTNKGVTTIPSTMNFTADAIRGVGINHTTKKTGAYSLEFSMFSGTGGYTDFYFTLGNDSLDGSDPLSSEAMSLARSAGALAFDGKCKELEPKPAIYQADGTTLVTALQFVQVALGGWANNRNVSYKFDVLASGDVDVYYDFSETANALTTKRNVIKGIPQGWLDGYITLNPQVIPEEKEPEWRVRYLNYIKVDGVECDFADINASNWSKIGEPSATYVSSPFMFTDADNDMVASNFEFTEEGLKDGDVVFDIKFAAIASKKWAVVSSWGLSLGQANKSDTTISTDVTSLLVGGVSNTNISFTKGNGTVAADLPRTSGTGDLPSPAYLHNAGGNYRLVGKKGGTVDFYRAIGAEKIDNLHSTFTGVNLNGFISFYNNSLTTDKAENVTFKFIDIVGNIKLNVESVEINKLAFTNAGTDSLIELSSTVNSYPKKDDLAVTYTITAGNDIAELIENNTKLQVKGGGTITVKATSNDDNSKFDSYTFSVKDKVFESFRLKEDFTTINDSDWTIMDEDNNIKADTGLFISKDFKSEEGGSAKLVSNVKFQTNPVVDTVFDITFRSELLTGLKYRSPSFAWGMMFGMKDINAKVGDVGVGFMKIDYVSTSVYKGTAKISATTTVDENCQVYNEAPYGYTVRMVGHKNGTLDLYRGYGEYEKITDKFASYTGLDFNGYVAITTNSDKRTETGADNDYEVMFSNVVLDGNVEIDNEFTVDNVIIDTEVFRDAIVSEIPLTCKAIANTTPNLNAYRGVTYSLVSGNATLNWDKLVITGEGKIKIKATSTKDTAIFSEYEFNAILLSVTEIVVDETVFRGLTNDSQPIPLVATLKCNSLANKHQQVIWTVVSGNAEVVAGQVRITGIGAVVLKVQSVYVPTMVREIAFTIADADAGQDNVGDDNTITTGCGSVVDSGNGGNGGLVGLILVGATLSALFLLKKKNNLNSGK